MSLLTLKNIYYSVGTFPLLNEACLEIKEKERIALIGRNGAGKSTLLKILSGVLQPEAGERFQSESLRISRLSQELPSLEDITVYEFVAQGLSETTELLAQYDRLTAQVDGHDETWMNKISALQKKIDHLDGWQIEQRVEQIIQALDLPAEKKLTELSGGWRRRADLGAALVKAPDILLLDEPTNHLDLKAIEWLETFLLNYPQTIIFITHDRALLSHIATRIVELDRGELTSYPPEYDVYLTRKAQRLAAEERENQKFDKKLSEEEQWIRQGVKARRTRNEGRVRALEALRAQRQQRRVVADKPNFKTQALGQKSQSKTVLQAEKVYFGYPNAPSLIKDFSFTIQRGDKVAIIGANGSGKTTLVKLLTGQLEPTQGTIKQSPTNQIALFDQHRDQLDGEATVMANVVQGSDQIEANGKKKHVIGYLGDFLFSPARCRTSAKTLSGGEQNRLMLAKMFAQEANILVLDEPTNDLDVESLELLESILLEYSGTVIIISHDRAFIDNIATHCISVEENGKIGINVGGYSDWLARNTQKMSTDSAAKPPKQKLKATSPPVVKTKLSFNEARELATLITQIEQLETEKKALEAKMCDPTFYQQAVDEINRFNVTLGQLNETLSSAYARWEALDEKSQ